MLCTRCFFGFPLTQAFLAVTLILVAFLSLAACGGEGDDAAPAQAPTDVLATPVPPATDPPAPTTVAPVATVPPAATVSPSSEGAMPEAPTESPVAAPTVVAEVPPTQEAPAGFFLPRAVRNLGKSCSDVFRQMLLDYDGAEQFGAEVAKRLSDEFVLLRPDCLDQGWAPEFSVDGQVCVDASDLPLGWRYKPSQRHSTEYLHPTSRLDNDSNFRGTPYVSTRMNVHFFRVPLYSAAPERMLPVNSGEVVGGCWHYRGPSHGGGQWFQSLIKYRGGSIPEGGRLSKRNRVGGMVRAEFLGMAFPECDHLLQTVISAQLDSGILLDSPGVGDAVDEARLLAEGVCDEEILVNRGWIPAPVEGPVGGCPGGPATGIQSNGSFVVNWGENHYDGYGASACWVRSPDGEWGGYLRPVE